MARRIGIYPGTFDPVHQGHLAFCLEVIKRGEVDEVVLLPERSPRSKPEATALLKRMDLLEAATAPFPSLRVVSLASERFTVDRTLPELSDEFQDAHLHLLIGSDIISSLHAWENLDVLLSDMSIIVGMRHVDTVFEVETALERIGRMHGTAIRYSIVETAHADVASSYIRSGNMVADFERLHI